MCNLILEGERFPNEWSVGLIVPILKCGNTLEKTNYRGISILNCIGKMFTMVINENHLIVEYMLADG